MLERDYPLIDDVTAATIEKTKKMLMVLAQSVPQMPTMNTLYGQLETGRDQGLKMLHALERANLLMLLTDNTKSLKSLGRPEKIFLNNPNLIYALGANIEIGTVRETFFLNQLQQRFPVSYPAKGDFLSISDTCSRSGARTRPSNSRYIHLTTNHLKKIILVFVHFFSESHYQKQAVRPTMGRTASRMNAECLFVVLLFKGYDTRVNS